MNWSIQQSSALYNIAAWSEGFISINEQGKLCVTPFKDKACQIALTELVKQLETQGLSLPILIRFSDILKSRVRTLIDAFERAMRAHDYPSAYTAVYPIKVNQQRRVIEDVITASNGQVGLESGSKPELLINIALAREGSTLICNGYKDREYIRLALISARLGFNTYIVIEKLGELQLIMDCCNELGIRPKLGIRIRLSSIASGNWQNTGGDKSKFGLHANQLLAAISRLQEAEYLSCLELLHFHIGSQVPDLNDLESGLIEGARLYVQLRKMSVPITCLDIGGGLGVDYEGTGSTRYNSMNYTIEDYATLVIRTISRICTDEQIEMPDIVTESGRAMTAHHAMLVTNIIDIEESVVAATDNNDSATGHHIIDELHSLMSKEHDPDHEQLFTKLNTLYSEAKKYFAAGQLDLKQWARVDELYIAQCQKIYSQANLADDLKNTLHQILSAKYFCNFSVFQTMPDTWAIDQIFPIVPLQRLLEKPDQRCTIQDLTCDSDGRIDYYVDGEGIETSLPVHSINSNEPYLIGIFLLGAYQEILGDIHNLFGDSASVNVELDNENEVSLSELDPGDRVKDLFQIIHIDADQLIKRYQELIANCELIGNEHDDYLQQLAHGLEGYTYLEE